MNDTIRILAVDDNQTNLKIVTSLLKDKGYDISLANDGASALSTLAENPVDIILLDVMMPEMDGFEVCERLKADTRTKDIPVIFLTARNETNDIVKGFEVGGVDYITKPFQKEELVARINNHVQLKLARDLLRKYADEYKDSRNEVMKMLLELSKVVKAS